MESSKIAWTENTFNPWIGCTKVSPGCAHCYAEGQNKQCKWNGGTWGPGSPRMVTSDAYWKKPLQWDKSASERGVRTKVFCASLADVFDAEAPVDARERLWSLIRQTPNLDWLILTKRPENFAKYLPADWGDGYVNVWLGVTCEDRKHGLPRVHLLRNTPAQVRFLSCEPLLEDVSTVDLREIDWLIVGGESGHDARKFDTEWARSLLYCCPDDGVNFFMKQLGSAPVEDGSSFRILYPNGNGKRDVHGTNPLNFPWDLQIQGSPDAPSDALISVPEILAFRHRQEFQQEADSEAAATQCRNAIAMLMKEKAAKPDKQENPAVLSDRLQNSGGNMNRKVTSGVSAKSNAGVVPRKKGVSEAVKETTETQPERASSASWEDICMESLDLNSMENVLDWLTEMKSAPYPVCYYAAVTFNTIRDLLESIGEIGPDGVWVVDFPKRLAIN